MTTVRTRLQLRWGRPFYVGLSGHAYQTLLGDGPEGPVAVMLVGGVELDPSTLNKRLVGTEDRLR